MWKTWDQTLGREDPLEKEMATHSSTLAWKKDGSDEPICRAAIENRPVDTAGEGEDGANWQTNIETYMLSYVK